MRPLLLDTNAYSAFRKGSENILQIIQLVEEIVLSPIVIGELLAGFEGGNKTLQNKKEFDLFLESIRVKIYPITKDTAHFFSKIISHLKAKGRPIPTNDIWIGAQALEHGCQICTLDRHFHEIDGINVIDSPLDLI